MVNTCEEPIVCHLKCIRSETCEKCLACYVCRTGCEEYVRERIEGKNVIES